MDKNDDFFSQIKEKKENNYDFYIGLENREKKKNKISHLFLIFIILSLFFVVVALFLQRYIFQNKLEQKIWETKKELNNND